LIWGNFVVQNNIITDFDNDFINFWLSFVRKDEDQESLNRQQFIENQSERIIVSDYLKNFTEYLYGWNEIPGNDNGRLIDFLNQNYTIDWVKNAKIDKIDNDRTIRISNEKNSLSLRLNDEKTRVNLKIDDGRTCEFVVKTENGKLNIYPTLSTLRRMIYEGGLISNQKHFGDENNVYDKYVFFILSCFTSIFWLLEDNPNSIEGNKLEFATEIKIIAEGLEKSNPKTIVNGLMRILHKIKELDIEKPTQCGSVELHDYPNLEYKNRKKFVEDAIIKSELDNKLFDKQFDIFKFFDNPNPQNFLTPLILNIYAFLKKENCFSIIGIERSGIPIASLVAYEFDIPLHILRTVPEIKLLPNKVIKNKAVIIDDISITGKNLEQSKIKLNEIGVKSLKTLVTVKDKYGKNVDKFFIEKNGNNYKYKNKFIDFNLINLRPSLHQDLKTTIKNYCTKKGYWFSEYAYCKGIFHSICDQFIKLIEDRGIQNRCLIISTSTFGLPFASVVSYKLQRPLYLFSRRPNLMLDFNRKESLKEYFENGFTSIAFIDDVFSSGVTEDVAEKKLKEIAKDINKDINLEIKRFVLVFLADESKKSDDIAYIIDKNELI